MGKFGQFFRKIGEGIKKGATKVFDWSRNAVQKVAKVIRPAADIASKFGGLMRLVPGKFGKFGDLIYKGSEYAKGITNMLPNSKAKDKINEAIDKGVNSGQNLINKASEGVQRFNNITQPWIDSGVNIARHIANGADYAYKMMPQQLHFN